MSDMRKEKVIREALAYDDVLLVPQYSEVLPTDVDIQTTLAGLKLRIPFLSAAMDTVTESAMASAMAAAGGMGVIHKNMTAGKQAAEVARVVKQKLPVAAAVSVSDEQFERAQLLVKAGVAMLVVDSAHGHSTGVLAQVRRLKKTFKNKILVIGGNVATADGTAALIAAGADVVKVGIGPGSICTTRIVAGIGVPQLTAVLECSAAARKLKKSIIADGGLKYSGDIVKALAAGAAAIMAGGLFAATKEAPGKLVRITREGERGGKGKQMKEYRGMGSLDAMAKGSKDRYGQGEVRDSNKLVPEGVVSYQPYRGPVTPILQQLAGGVRAGMGYCGAKNIFSLQKNAQFVRITQAGLAESHPHHIDVVKKSPND